MSFFGDQQQTWFPFCFHFKATPKRVSKSRASRCQVARALFGPPWADGRCRLWVFLEFDMQFVGAPYPSRSPSSALLPPFLGEGSPNRQHKNIGYPYLTSLLEDLALLNSLCLGRFVHVACFMSLASFLPRPRRECGSFWPVQLRARLACGHVGCIGCIARTQPEGRRPCGAEGGEKKRHAHPFHPEEEGTRQAAQHQSRKADQGEHSRTSARGEHPAVGWEILSFWPAGRSFHSQ